MAAVPAVLIVGVPRSGTTWVGQILGRTDGAVYCNEPDGDHDPFAFRARLTSGVTSRPAPGSFEGGDLERLWTGALAGGRHAGTARDRVARALYGRVPVDARWAVWLGGGLPARLRLVARLAVPRVPAPDARHVVVKSVRAELALEWIARRFAPRVLIVERHPFNVLASWIELGYARDPREMSTVADVACDRWGVVPPPARAPLLERQSFYYAVLSAALREAAARHPDWTRVRHEDLCGDSDARFRALAGALGLEWGEAASAHLADSDGDGTGYDTHRRRDAQAERWRARLDAKQLSTIRATLARFPPDLVDAEGFGAT